MGWEGTFGLERSKNFDFERDNCVFGNRIKPKNVQDLHLPRIRRKPLPPGVCYVCSHLDVDGRYQHPHSYLFRKGFFNKCSHHPKAPHPTLIESGEGTDVFHFNKQLSDEELKLSVNVRVKSRKEKYSESPVPIFGQTHFDTAVLNGVQLESNVGENSKFELPSIFDPEDKMVSGTASLRSSRNSIKSDKRGRLTGSNSSRLTASSDSWKNNVRNAAPSQNRKYNKIGTRRSDENWKLNPTISDRSWLEADGYIQKEMSDDGNEPDESPDTGFQSQVRPQTFSVSEGDKQQQTSPEENQRPKSDNVVSPSSSRISRPKGAKRSSDFSDEDEAHLKYHHRSDNESLPPHDAFSVASREGSLQQQIRSRLNSKLSEPELALIGAQISRRSSEVGERIPSQSSSSFILQRLTGSMATHWCSCHDVDYSKIKCEECLKIGDHEKWCVHAISSSSRQGLCPHCGKPIMKTSKRASNMSFRSSQPASIGKQSQHSDEKHVKFEDDGDETLKTHAKTFEKKDYEDDMDTQSDDEVWETREELLKRGIDPDIHKKAYLKALFELRMSRLSKINELDESWILDRISKPTFSYFKLRPGQKKAFPDGPKSIGLTPDNSHLPTMKKSMKHIFGKIKVDDYYPGGKKNPSRVTVTVKKEKNKQTMPIHSYQKAE